ncbi:hypothetical protein EGM87_03750 [Sphingobium sp. RSMS]|uniref:hypothetical protein n=1 Tax=Sphingobium sp. RSMS TaxID=520734 RepID=UPI0010F6C07F|nr:hypothetical protein [Sphingobium sp. RSMS]UXC91610.1 hypothetical protein EGM87_03750 [Sphingobium sp. RSMS]
MDYDDFAERFLAALYLETETTGNSYHTAGELIEKYGFNPRSNWIDRIADDWEGSYFRDISKVLNGYDGWGFRISAAGARKVETDFVDLDEIRKALNNNADAASSGTVDSAKWTGLPIRQTLDETAKVELSNLLAKAELELDVLGAGNSEKAMARAYIVAAKALADAPDPPVDIIWELIGRANNLAGVASLFVSIIALFQTVAH